MINKFFAFLFAATFSAQSIAALNNPFNKTSSVDVGPDVKWEINKGVAVKASKDADNDGTFYQLSISPKEMKLNLLESASGKAKSFDQLKIEDLQLDGDTSALFKWCLANQESHDRFLQQGLSVKKNICQNRGRAGEFVVKLNQATYDRLKTTKNITFIIKPYRSGVIASFDTSDMAKVFAELSGRAKPAAAKQKSTEKFLSKPVNVKPAAAPVVKSKPVKLCSIKPPANFASIPVEKYNCTDNEAKATARKKMASSVSKARAKKAQQEKLAKEKQKKSQQSLAEQKRLEEQRKKEEEAISRIEQNMNKVRSQVSERMINMCKKKWADGEHRCYCEPYLEFAPPGIKSDASCGGS